MTIVAEDFDNLFTPSQIERFNKSTDKMSDVLLKLVIGKVSQNKDDIIRDIVLRAGGEVFKILEQHGTSFNPSVNSGTIQNYSRQQIATILLKEIMKARRNL